MLTLDQLKGQHVCIATPCYGGQVFQNYLLSLIKLIYTCQRYGIHLSFIIRGGDSLIPRTRNSIVAEFLSAPEYTHLLWIDADIGFEPNAVLRLLRADQDVAVGIYPMKNLGWPEKIPAEMTPEEFTARYAIYPFNPKGETIEVDQDGFTEVLDAPTGLMLIKRGVFDRMIEAYPDLRYVPDRMPGLEGIADKIDPLHFRFFDVMTEESGRYLSEDYAFCRRWQKIDGRIFADIDSKLTHQGSYLYKGDLLGSIQAKMVKL